MEVVRAQIDAYNRGDYDAALALYERLGFLTHHEYRYLLAP